MAPSVVYRAALPASQFGQGAQGGSVSLARGLRKAQSTRSRHRLDARKFWAVRAVRLGGTHERHLAGGPAVSHLWGTCGGAGRAAVTLLRGTAHRTAPRNALP